MITGVGEGANNQRRCYNHLTKFNMKRKNLTGENVIIIKTYGYIEMRKLVEWIIFTTICYIHYIVHGKNNIKDYILCTLLMFSNPFMYSALLFIIIIAYVCVCVCLYYYHTTHCSLIIRDHQHHQYNHTLNNFNKQNRNIPSETLLW